jgi:hypothetical protein
VVNNVPENDGTKSAKKGRKKEKKSSKIHKSRTKQLDAGLEIFLYTTNICVSHKTNFSQIGPVIANILVLAIGWSKEEKK